MRKMFTVLTIMCLAIGNLASPVMAAGATDFRIPASFMFNRDIQKDTYVVPDVAYLQNLLNMSSSTQVAATGAGSNQNLSFYYGSKTRAAVSRFQTVFANDIAYEKDLAHSTSASAYVVTPDVLDIFTRTVMNKLVVIYQDARSYATTSTTSVAVTKNSTSSSIIDIPSLSDKPESFIYKTEKNMFALSPQGLLLRAIGGSALVDKVYSYTPGGKVGEQLGVSGSGGSGAGALAAGAGALGAASLLGGAGGGAGVVTPFGGESVAMTNCTCSSNILLTIKDVKSKTNIMLIYQPGVTQLYQQYRPTTGVNMLGNYTSGGTCLIYAGTTCTSGGTPQGTMTIVGTSLTI